MNFFDKIKNGLNNVSNFSPNSNAFFEEDRKDVSPTQIKGFKVKKFITRKKLKVSKTVSLFSKMYFLDGIQRTILLGFSKNNPLFFHTSSAGVLSREGRKLSVYEKPKTQNFFLSNDSDLKNLKDFVFVNDLNLSNILIKSNYLRRKLEYEQLIALTRVLSNSDLVFFDGYLPALKELKFFNAIGVIKRHHVNYLGNDSELLDLKVGEISRIFLLEKEGESFFYSFYLKIFNAFFDEGIVRVEIPKNICGSLDKILHFASIVFKERFPFSSSSNQAFKKLYPISVVEKFLSSTIPDKDLIKFYLKGFKINV